MPNNLTEGTWENGVSMIEDEIGTSNEDLGHATSTIWEGISTFNLHTHPII